MLKFGKLLLFFFFCSITITHCTINFVKNNKLKSLEKDYAGVYLLKKDISITPDDTLKAGTRVRLYFFSGSDSIKVYAYEANQRREEAVGKNILYLFETDFPDGKYDDKILAGNLKELLQKTK